MVDMFDENARFWFVIYIWEGKPYKSTICLFS